MDRRQFLHAAGIAPAAPMASAWAKGDEPRPPSISAPPFRLGLVTYNLAATWDLATLLRVCQAVGISPVELRTSHRHGVEPSLGRSERREVRQKFADAGIEIWGSGTTCEFHSPEPAVVEQNVETCKRFVELVADLGGRGVKVRPNGLPRGVPVPRTLEQIAKALIRCGQAAADHGLEIWVEVHGPGTSEPAHMKTIMEQCGHPRVGLTWNSNATDIKNGSVREAFELLKPWIRSCHINEIYKDLPPLSASGKAKAAAQYPYRELFHLFRTSGYDRVTMIEVGKSMPDAAAAQEMLCYYQTLWRMLAA